MATDECGFEKSKSRVYDQLVRLSIAKRQPVTSELAEIYTEYLSKYQESEVMSALMYCFENIKFFPDISEIKKIIEKPIDKDSIAQEITGKIFEAVKIFGSHQILEARESLGQEAWGIVERFGGWKIVCALEYRDMNTARAQLKNIAKGYMETSGETFLSMEQRERNARLDS